MGETRSSRRYAGDVRNNFAASDEKPTFNRQRCDERKWMKPEGKRGVGDGGWARHDGKRKPRERIRRRGWMLQRRRRTEITARR